MWNVGDTKGQEKRCVEQHFATLVVSGLDARQPLGQELNLRIVGPTVEKDLPTTKADETVHDGPVIFSRFHLVHEKKRENFSMECTDIHAG